MADTKERVPVGFLVFFTSAAGLLSELMFMLMLSLKSWSHTVFLVISGALLGYGIGTTTYLLLRRRIERHETRDVVAVLLLAWIIATGANNILLPHLPTNLSTGDLLLSLGVGSVLETFLTLPFVAIGLLLAYLFSNHVEQAKALYAMDLMGGGLGAALMFPLLVRLGPTSALAWLGLAATCFFGIIIARTRFRKVGLWSSTILFLLELWGCLLRGEPEYRVGHGWEWIPGYFPKDQVHLLHRAWQPMGRTDLYEITSAEARKHLYEQLPGVFQINVSPPPPFSYFTNNFRAGTPVFKLRPEVIQKDSSQVKTFTWAMEAPYLYLKQPRVFIIGTGGGRDLFMARSHGAREIHGAEINPGTFRAMSKGGTAYEYSGRLYDLDGIAVENIDGRFAVKRQAPGSFDLVVLNGVDSYAALASGADSYAESYLYTLDAIRDYLRILSPEGLLNLNRPVEVPLPRESLRLFALSLQALADSGAGEPWKHIMVTKYQPPGTLGWAIMLVRKTPFTQGDQERLLQYLLPRETTPLFLPSNTGGAEQNSPFYSYVQALRTNSTRAYFSAYPHDVSLVTDNNPFFYKSHKWRLASLVQSEETYSQAFAFQLIVVMQTLVFILLFIFAPLFVSRKVGASSLPSRGVASLVSYFACLGFGFIVIEIVVMQRFALLLGSALYSVPITLASILVFAGIGSTLSRRWGGGDTGLRPRVIVLFSSLVVILVGLNGWLTGSVMTLAPEASFALRATSAVILVAPLAVCLGTFFPSGLVLVGSSYPDGVAWAWGINAGFTVLGSTLAIVLSQHLGFTHTLWMAAASYGIAAFAYWRLHRTFKKSPVAPRGIGVNAEC